MLNVLHLFLDIASGILISGDDEASIISIIVILQPGIVQVDPVKGAGSKKLSSCPEKNPKRYVTLGHTPLHVEPFLRI